VPRSTHELVEIRVIFKPGVVVRAFLSEPQMGAMTQPAFGTPDVASLALAWRVMKEPGAVIALRTCFPSGIEAVMVFVVTTFLNTDGVVTSALAWRVSTGPGAVEVLEPVWALDLCLVMVLTTVVVVKTVVSSEADVDVVVVHTSDGGETVSPSHDAIMLSKMELQVSVVALLMGRSDHDQTSPSSIDVMEVGVTTALFVGWGANTGGVG
jgi:hypothetical protein